MRQIGTLAAISVVFATMAMGQEVFPPGFSRTALATPSVVLGAVSVEVAPDGDVYMAGFKGNIYIRRSGSVFFVHSIYDGVFPGNNEEGMHNLVLDPDYATNKHLWIFHSYFDGQGPSVDRLSRFTNVNDQLVDEVVIFEGPTSNLPLHAGGCLTFTAQGTILLGVGDDGLAGEAQLPHDLRGSVLHMDRQGNPVPGNPYFDGVDGNPLVWAVGMRNPYRCALQPETGNLFLGDVGGGTWEEIDIIIRGENFGWPLSEGPSVPAVANVTYPIYSYNHDGLPAAVIGGDFAPATFHPDYEGDYFFADHQRKKIYRMVMETDTRVAYVEEWATLQNRICEVDFGPDGAMYLTGHGSFGFAVARVAFTPGPNNQPVAAAAADPESGLDPLLVSLDAGASSDPDEDTLTYLWDFGDGDSSTAESPGHMYAAGVHIATVTVDDGNGMSDVSPPIRIVAGNQEPGTSVTSPLPGTSFDGGQVVNYSGAATDPEDGSLACANFTWNVTFEYDGHSIPVQGPRQGGCSGSFVTLTTGNPSADSSYEIRLTALDSGAPLGVDAVLEGNQSVAIQPNTSEITLQTAPVTDLTVEIDGSPMTAPAVVPSVVNFVRTVGAPPTLYQDGHTYSWLSWSDGGDQEHDIVTPSSASSLTATFGCDVIVEAQTLRLDRGTGDALDLTWDAVSDPCLNPGAEQYRIYSSPTATPASPPGAFPVDPPWTLEATSQNVSESITPAAGDRYILVVPVGTDMIDGAVGHYAGP